MRPIYIELNPAPATYTSAPIVLDQYVAPGNIVATLAVKNAGASVTAVLEFTTDDIFDTPPAVFVWQPFTATPFNTSGSVTISGVGAAQAAFAFAPKALRVRITGITGSPAFSIQVIQLGIAST